MYIYRTKIRLFHTDAAKLIFYSSLFNMAYECSEEFLEKTEYGVKKILDDGKFLIPVVHTEADYFKPLRMGDKVEIRMILSSLGKSSFTLSCAFFNESNELAANVKTVKVMVDAESGKPMEIPKKLKKILNSINI